MELAEIFLTAMVLFFGYQCGTYATCRDIAKDLHRKFPGAVSSVSMTIVPGAIAVACAIGAFIAA